MKKVIGAIFGVVAVAVFTTILHMAGIDGYNWTAYLAGLAVFVSA